ncbi:ubiquitin carboxyl-terminal hydrolase-like protein isozyme L3 [Lasiosphaeria miniovina]|uniref:Ubiquitin carboxyl-terminal hydrolase n=1 Tax=Lasiosphaeria miniovina TaxID=1954250 RepID=A0AA40BFW4_9PEZI|nr:ubiquitin carboxyl-terminal hydrolase-like protein isozyme L3 [Lasiosphaeria miniovina]KAK0733501.1 ubiquitin carboxyl-terminal hydrolase-like protein isozyme L3 [Lasiosphaeria miniovina]
MTTKKIFVILENNPEVMNALAAKLGLSPDLAFYDVWSLDEPSLLAHIPRPAHALLVIVPLTDAWNQEREREDVADYSYYYDKEGDGSGSEHKQPPPVIWFKQTIGEACGSIGMLHCAINGAAAQFIVPSSALDKIRTDALPLAMDDRAQMLYDSQPFEDAHASVAAMGDTVAPPVGVNGVHTGQHFIAFVKGDDGHLWELEGSRRGPIDRGQLAEDEDVLSPRALELGLKRIIKLDQDAGSKDLRFSCTALAPRGES